MESPASSRPLRSPQRWAAAALATFWLAAAGCASTEFFNEGPGQPSDRASGSVPPGSLGVCKRAFSKKPPIVNAQLWEDAPPCTLKTPPDFIRLGYGAGAMGAATPEADKQMDKILEALRQAPKEETGNSQFVGLMRNLRDQAGKDRDLRSRVAKETARSSACDFTYMLNTMGKEHDKLFQGNKCAAFAYDPKQKTEACIFDTTSAEAVWVTGGWDCVVFTNAAGDEMSCHRLCSYDDYCARQVGCAAPDLDLLLCTMGVCLPEPRAGF